ncbi:UNVERIFIED_CONTAM: hypothetical protein FKN15_012949 [Acipenser sinensis]
MRWGDLTGLSQRADGTIADLLKDENLSEDVVGPDVKYCLQKSLDPEDVGCYLNPGQNDSLQECGFNATAKTILVIHGWTMSGMVEKWLQKLLSAIQEREKEANVIVVDWINLAHQVYPDAVNHTKTVGHDIAKFLEWLKTVVLARVEIATNILRVKRLLKAILHIRTNDIYTEIFILQQISNGAICKGFGEAVKCEHERSVHLFIDSLLNKDHQSFAYRCTDPSRFKKGICLSCRKNRCNNLGYNIKKMRSRRNSKMYLKTRADMPFGGKPINVPYSFKFKTTRTPEWRIQ